MKKFAILSAAVVGALLLLAAGPLRPAFAADSYGTLDSTVVTVSTSMQTGATKILSATNNAEAFVVLFASGTAGATSEEFVIGSVVGLSTNPASGSFRIPVNQVFTLYDYKGPLWAISTGSTPLNVSVLRKR